MKNAPSETHPNVHAVRDFGANGGVKDKVTE